MDRRCTAALPAAACKCLCIAPLAGLDPRARARAAPLRSEMLLDTFGSGRSSSSRRRGDASLASATLPIGDAPNCICGLFPQQSRRQRHHFSRLLPTMSVLAALLHILGRLSVPAASDHRTSTLTGSVGVILATADSEGYITGVSWPNRRANSLHWVSLEHILMLKPV